MRTFRAAVIAAIVSAFLAPAAARAASVAYDFKGVCTDCADFGLGTLVLQNYTPGDGITNANFVSFDYSSNLIPSLSVTPSNLYFINGSLAPSAASDTVVIEWNGGTGHFQSLPPIGSWLLLLNSVSADFGPSSSWQSAAAAVPIPAALPLFATGLAGLGWLAHRRRKHAAA